VLEPVGTSLNKPVNKSSTHSARLVLTIQNICKYPWKQARHSLALQRKLVAPDGDLGLARLVICRTDTLKLKKKLNSVFLVRERTIPTERLPLVG
jgi:hypothetical protein